MRNRKGYISQNCLFTCDFDFLFIYALTGWDGSTADAKLWHDAHTHDLEIPQGKYLLADAGFGTCDALLVPYRGVHYHLKEWRQANLRYVVDSPDLRILLMVSRPQTREELFNLWHAALRNIIERIFGVVKHRFRVLQIPPEYNMHIQARLPLALCTIHNFIQRYDPNTSFDPGLGEQDPADDGDQVPGGPGLGDGPADAAERRRADQRRDNIAQEMWIDYQEELRRRAL